MRKAFLGGGVMFALALLLTPAPAPAQEGGNVARVVYWTVRDGHQADFETGLAAHNQVHVAQKDPHALLTWQIVSGKRTGQYLRGSFGHQWADFDVDPAVAAADEADSAKNVDPHIQSAEPIFGRFVPELSNPVQGGEPATVSWVIYYHLHQGKARQFREAVGKIHAALGKVEGGWPAYHWYSLSSGDLPTYVLSLPRANWAAFAPGETPLAAAVAAAHGEEGAAAIWQSMSDAVESQYAYYAVLRMDLSYFPASE